MALGWTNTSNITNKGWTCGYCGKEVGGNVGFYRSDSAKDKYIYICPHCENPTAFIKEDNDEWGQFPGPVCGNEVEALPRAVAALYGEIRRCVQYSANTSAAMVMRKLLMHIAVEKGADEGKSFVFYVNFLNDNGWIPPNGKDWVDAIRGGGNVAAHQIDPVSEDEAKRLLDFTEMLLKIVYEFPAKLQP